MEEIIDLQKEIEEDKISEKIIKKSFFTKSNLFTAAIILVVAFLPILLDAPSSQKDPSKTAEKSPEAVPVPLFAAKIPFLEGQVEIWSGKANSWLPIELNRVIGGDAQIRTGKESKVIIKLDNDSEIKLNENSHIIFKGMDGEKIEINQIIGQTYLKAGEKLLEIISGETRIIAKNSLFSVINEKMENNQRRVVVEVIQNTVSARLEREKESIEKEVKEGEKLIILLNEPVEKAVSKFPLLEEEINQNEFYLWNQIEDKNDNEITGTNNDIAADGYNSNLISAAKDEKKIALQTSYQPGAGVVLYWSSKEKSLNGFFVLRSLSPNPLYPDCEFIYLPSPTIRSYVWPTNGDVGKYYFKICSSGENGECQEYSNEKENDIR